MSLNSFFLSIIIYELKAHFYFLSLIGSIISNNLFVIFLASLSGQGIFSLWKVWIISLIGILISDTIWFIIGKSATINKIARHRHFLYNYYSIKSILPIYITFCLIPYSNPKLYNILLCISAPSDKIIEI